MKVRILQINEDTLRDIERVKKYAENNIVSFDRILAAVENPKECIPVGDNPDHVVHIHDGYRVVYSLEEQKMGIVQHISISVDTKNKYPNEFAVDLILEKFGMKSLLESTRIDLDQNTQSINILQIKA